jgi:hypothetical protein
MGRFHAALLSAAASILFAAGASAAAPPASGKMVFSDLCRTADGFRGSRLTLARAAGGDSGEYQWGDTAAVTAPLDRLVVGADAKVAFRYMPDADNPEVFVRVTGLMSDDAFSGEADGKPLRLPRQAPPEKPIPACRLR